MGVGLGVGVGGGVGALHAFAKHLGQAECLRFTVAPTVEHASSLPPGHGVWHFDASEKVVPQKQVFFPLMAVHAATG